MINILQKEAMANSPQYPEIDYHNFSIISKKLQEMSGIKEFERDDRLDKDTSL